MPTPIRQLSHADIERIVRARCAGPGTEGRVGLEIEWIPVPISDPGAHAPFPVVEAVARAAPRPAGSVLTFEPGGQIELSSPPLPDVAAAIACIREDAAHLRAALADHGIGLRGDGLDPRPVRRVREDPRYRAMETYFDGDGFAGRRMMNATASIQVNLDLGPGAIAERRWRLAHALGPVLAATFANSPLMAGKASGWRSTRMANWWAMDATRTHPVSLEGDAVADWERYVAQASVMLVRVDDDEFVPMRERISFARWVDEGHALGWPTEADLVYHMTTLFPPVRLRGWIELRMIDALPDEWWPVAGAVTAALLDDDEASARAEAACAPVAGAWIQAFRSGLSAPPLAEAARACFAAALEALPRRGVDARTIADAARFYDRYVARGRCPADDALEPEREMALEVG